MTASILEPRAKPPQEAVHVTLVLQVGMVGVGPTTGGFLHGLLKLYNPEPLLYSLSNKPAAPAVGNGLPQFAHERVGQHDLGLHRSPDVINTLVSLTIWPVKPVLHTHPITLIQACRQALPACAVLHRINGRCVFIWTPRYLEPSLTWSRRVVKKKNKKRLSMSERW